MNANQQLLEDIESIKHILMARATGERADEGKYQRLRHRLMNNALVKDKLPSFVRTCGSMHEFWTVIQDQIRTYAKRRSYITEQFDEVVSFLEQQAATSGDEPLSQLLSTIDAPHVAAAWQSALEKRDSDPVEAITSARTLVEAGDVVAQLNDRELNEVPITIDSRALAAKGFDLNQRFTGQFGGHSLRHGLARLLQECQLVLDYRFEQLVVTTADDAEKWTDRTGIDTLQLPAGTRWAEALNEETGVEFLRVADWIRGFREQYGLDVQCASTVDDSEPGERIQVTMHEVRRPNRDRLRILLGRGRLTATLEGNTMVIAPQHE